MGLINANLGVARSLGMSEKSYTKIGKGIGVPPYQLRDAKFEKAPKGSKVYCYITVTDGVRYAMTKMETIRLSGRGGKGPVRFRAWLEEQEDPI